MTENNADEKMDMDVDSTVAKTPEKKELKDTTKYEEDDDDSDDSLPLRKLAAKRKRGKGTPATKVTLGRKKGSPVPSTPEDTSLDFEDEEEPNKVATKPKPQKSTKQANKKGDATIEENGETKKSRKKEPNDTHTKADGPSGSSADEKHKEDDDLAACCLCHCALDYSDRSAFFEADRRQEIDNKSSGSDDEPLYFQPTDPYLPADLYDASNALVYCDTCDRLYHQKCHFVPLMVVPRGKWSCLVCTTKEKLTSSNPTVTTPPAKGKRGKKKAAPVASRKDALFTKHKLSRMFKSPLPPTKLQQYLTEDGTEHNKGYHTGPEMEWELATARDKAILWTKTLKHTIPSWLQSQMSNLSQARTALETLTQTKQNRQHFLQNKASKRGSQELAQTLVKLTGAKWKMRQMILNLEEIRANPERHIQLMQQWCQGAKAEESAKGETTNAALAGPPPKSFTERVLFPFGQYPPRTVPRTPEMLEGLETAKNGSNGIPSEIVTEKKKANVGNTASEDKESGNKKKKSPSKKKSKAPDDGSRSGVSLDDLVCCVCLSNEASDENDMLLCDAQGCFRAFHMECLEPQMTLKEVKDTQGEDWFCPLCSGMAACIHKIQSYYMGEDWDRRRQERAVAEAKKQKATLKSSPAKSKKKKADEDNNNEDGSIGNDSDGDDDSLKSWEKPADVFPESKWEYETALELKAGKQNEQTEALLRDALGEGEDEQEGNLLDYLSDGTDDEDEDAQFDLEAFHEERKRQYEEMEADGSDDDSTHSSQATLVDMSSVELKIGKDELNALSEGSDNDSDDNSGSDSGDEEGSKAGRALRRSRRLRKVQPPEEMKKTLGTEFDVTNIVQGKRRRKPVDYRKLNDALFGGLDADEIAKIDDQEDFRIPMRKKYASNSSGDEGSDDEDSDNGTNDSNNEDSGSEDESKENEGMEKETKSSRKRARALSDDDDIGSGNEAEDDNSTAGSQSNGVKKKKKEKKKGTTKPPATKKPRGPRKGKKASSTAPTNRNGTKEAKGKTKQNGKKPLAKKPNGSKTTTRKTKKNKEANSQFEAETKAKTK